MLKGSGFSLFSNKRLSLFSNKRTSSQNLSLFLFETAHLCDLSSHLGWKKNLRKRIRRFSSILLYCNCFLLFDMIFGIMVSISFPVFKYSLRTWITEYKIVQSLFLNPLCLVVNSTFKVGIAIECSAVILQSIKFSEGSVVISINYVKQLRVVRWVFFDQICLCIIGSSSIWIKLTK